MIERLKQGLAEDANAVADPETTLRLVEAVRALALRHGPAAVEHCVKVVTDLREPARQAHRNGLNDLDQ